MTPAGRPIRFLASVIGGWALVRIAMVWTATGELPEAIQPALPVPGIATPALAATSSAAALSRARATASGIGNVRLAARAVPPPAATTVRFASAATAPPGSTAAAVPQSGTRPETRMVSKVAGGPADVASGWSASAWFVARGGGPTGVAPGSQLGGSQAGFRVDRAIGRGFALTARVAAPLSGRGAEIAPGIAWQPGRLPLRAVAEYRLALDGGGSAAAVGASGGLSDTRLPAGFRLEAYAQAGAIARRGVEGYADGAVRIARAVAAVDRLRLDLGVGAWGARQRDAARIDVGPSVALRMPIGGDAGARLQLDWRQRIAGDARPGSGPALTLGADL